MPWLAVVGVAVEERPRAEHVGDVAVEVAPKGPERVAAPAAHLRRVVGAQARALKGQKVKHLRVLMACDVKILDVG